MRTFLVLLGLIAILGLSACHGWTIIDENGNYAHVHIDGCGHYYWHSAWYTYQHPADCLQCYPNYYGYGYGSGYYYWHGGWWTYAHPATCCCGGW